MLSCLSSVKSATKPFKRRLGAKFLKRKGTGTRKEDKNYGTAQPPRRFSHEVPQWFLENCVLTAEDLSEHKIPLRISDETTPDQTPRTDEDSSLANVYKIERAVYEPLLDLATPQDLANESQGHKSAPYGKRGSFAYDAVHLRFPGRQKPNGGHHFLTTIVQQFAKDSGADLITLSIDDFDDLAEHFLRLEGGRSPEGPSETQPMGTYFGGKRALMADDVTVCSEDSAYRDDADNKQAIETRDTLNFPFSALISAPDLKRTKKGMAYRQRPLVIQISDVRSLLDIHNGNVLKELRHAVASSETPAIVFSTADEHPEVLPPLRGPTYYSGCGIAPRPLYEDSDVDDDIDCRRPFGVNKFGDNHIWESRVLRATGTNSRPQAICVAPTRDEAQKDLFSMHQKLQESYEQRNVRTLQRFIRRSSDKKFDLTLIQPYTNWGFLKDTSTQLKLSKDRMDESDASQLASTISRALDEEAMKGAILQMGRRKEALDSWCESLKEMKRKGKWSNFSPQVKRNIKRIEANQSRYKWEQKFLQLLINPKDVDEGWSDIAIDAETRGTIMQLIEQSTNTDTSAYGILKHGRVGGALLYGPPGTGKTHLARVLAREAQATVLCASAADMMDKYIGETEKAIQGLFNLARMVTPCVIFIDEADSLFQARKADDKSWERSKTNQLLHEMDGLKRSENPPFVLLATNFPRELDYAVLRRVPSRIHIGLPSATQRVEIFQICLRDETLDPEVDLSCLSERSQGYSGSDIQTVCVQAALISNTFIGDSERRVLNMFHFEKAFMRSSPTTSKIALAEIKMFAKEFDSATLEKLNQEEKSEQMRMLNTEKASNASNACINCGKSPTTRGRARKTTTFDLWKAQQSWESPAWISEATTFGDPSNTESSVVEIECEQETLKAAADTPFQYLPLKPDSKQIRVISFEGGTDDVDSGKDGLLRCELRTVDLEDTVEAYSQLLSKSRSMGICHTPKYRLAQWQLTSTCRPQMKSTGSGTEPPSDHLLKEQWPRLVADNDLPLRGVEETENRFTWGDYITLSYVWGDSKSRQDILLNGHRFPITSNLYQALLHLRNSAEVYRKGLHIWVDAICINQDDLDERAAQVKKMGLIYSESLGVRAWLGQPGAILGEYLPVIRAFLDEIANLEISDLRWETLVELEIVQPLWMAVSGISAMPYWERLWVIQEIAMAPSITFGCGNHTFTTGEIHKLCYLVTNGAAANKFAHCPNENTPDVLVKMSQVVFRLFCLRPWHQTVEADRPLIDLVDVLRLAQSSRATDPRDKVYGLLSLLPGGIATKIQPNYNLSPPTQHTYTMFSKSCFQAEGNLNILARISKRPSTLQGLPSWALDLEAKRDTTDITMTAVRYRDHDANRGMRTVDFQFSEDSLLLFCQGVIVDSVDSLAAVRMWNPELEVEVSFDAYVGSNTTDAPSGIDWRLAIARVLMHNSHFEFSNNPSVLDIPWIDSAEVDDFKDSCKGLPTKDIQYYDFAEEDRCWAKFYHLSPLRQLFYASLWGNEDFLVGAKPLKSYFHSTEDFCHGTKAFMDISHELLGGFNGNRLFTTRRGLFGSGSKFAVHGDKIAVLSGCDMPLILRPKDKHYEVVGSCFVEGLMRGETAEGIDGGQFQLETLGLC